MAYYQFYKWKKYNEDGTDTGVSLIGNTISNTSFGTLAECQSDLPWEPGDVVISSLTGSYTECDSPTRTQDIDAFSGLSSLTSTVITGNKSTWYSGTTAGLFRWIYRDPITGATDETIHETNFTQQRYADVGTFVDDNGDMVFIDGSELCYTKYPSVIITGLNDSEYGTVTQKLIKDPNTLYRIHKYGSGSVGKIGWVSKVTIDWSNGTKTIEYFDGIQSVLEDPIASTHRIIHSMSINYYTMKGVILTTDWYYSDSELKIWNFDLVNDTYTDTGHTVSGLIASSHSTTGNPFYLKYYSPTNDTLFIIQDNTNYIIDQMNKKYLTVSSASSIDTKKLYKFTVEGKACNSYTGDCYNPLIIS